MSFSMVSAFKGFSLASSSSSSFFKGDSGSFNVASRPLYVSFPKKLPLTIENAHNNGAGSTKNGRDSKGQRLGVKIFNYQVEKPGSILVRKRGTKMRLALGTQKMIDFAAEMLPGLYQAKLQQNLNFLAKLVDAQSQAPITPQVILAHSVHALAKPGLNEEKLWCSF
ncbi:hypothetical protein K1719_044333 [Acacia pycnantha]|nr:hypothetical protein K1719_044333 [Acacia pycnantha]